MLIELLLVVLYLLGLGGTVVGVAWLLMLGTRKP